MTTEADAERPGRFRAAALLLGVSRLLLAPALLGLAYLGLEPAFIATLAAALAASLLDRSHSRRMGDLSSRRARVQIWSDFAPFASLPPCAYWLRPDLLHSEPVAFWAIVAAFAMPVTCTFIKYGQLTPYRTRA